MSTPKRYVHAFADGGREMAGLLGGKGAGLAEMTRLGLPVPPGFTVTTETCRAVLADGADPPELESEVARQLASLERDMARTLGATNDPLLLAVRSDGRVSPQGRTATVLGIGLGDASVAGLARATGQERCVWDCYRRLLQKFGHAVLHVDNALFERAAAALRKTYGLGRDCELDAPQLRALTAQFKTLIRQASGEDFPQDPAEQLRRAVRAVFVSWNSERARPHRSRERVRDGLGTAVVVQAMVFGNTGPDSGSGVAFSRDPATGAHGAYGDYLPGAQGAGVVSGSRRTLSLEALRTDHPGLYVELASHLRTLDHHYRDLCHLDFTVERGKLWILRIRVGRRAAEATFRIAYDLVDEHLITEDEALERVDGAALDRLMCPRFAPQAGGILLARGVPASPGAAVGVLVFDASSALSRSRAGQRTVLVRRRTTPDDLPGMIAADAVLTSRGGRTSHAAVVARGMGKVCVCGADSLAVDPAARRLTTAAGAVVHEGDTVSVDGAAGTVHLGTLPLTASEVRQGLESGRRESPLVDAVQRALAHADTIARLEVRADADTPSDAALARRLGARGVGLCRTEHMFFGERRAVVEDLLLARDAASRDKALAALLHLQRLDFTGILQVMDGLPVTIRLLDPPLNAFLPDLTELSVRVATARHTGPRDRELLSTVRKLYEHNPMLGLRGVRLGLVVPGLVAMQTRAIAEAVVHRLRAGGRPRAEIMIPLVATAEELRLARAEAERVLAEVSRETGHRIRCPIGTMIELPRAALTAARIAQDADFLSFGTDDLTQLVWGMSRDDAEASILPVYLDRGILAVSPFATLDEAGAGRLVTDATRAARGVKPRLETGICGEHGGDPASVHFFHRAGLDYVSCSPLRVPAARLEAGRAALGPVAVSDRAAAVR